MIIIPLCNPSTQRCDERDHLCRRQCQDAEISGAHPRDSVARNTWACSGLVAALAARIPLSTSKTDINDVVHNETMLLYKQPLNTGYADNLQGDMLSYVGKAEKESADECEY